MRLSVRRRARHLLGGRIVALALALTSITHAQTADDHASHHPEQAAADPNAPESAEAAPFPPAMNPAVMEQMMERMGVPPPRDLYPALMAMDELTEENRATAVELAHNRMQAGTAMMAPVP